MILRKNIRVNHIEILPGIIVNNSQDYDCIPDYIIIPISVIGVHIYMHSHVSFEVSRACEFEKRGENEIMAAEVRVSITVDFCK